jgi:CubicO group peptidase (beta-lactamase class C family)
MTMRWFSLLVLIGTAVAQGPKVSGDYVGLLGPLHLKLHLKAGADGTLEGTLDSVDQGAMGLRCANFHVDDKTLAFDVPSVGGKWHGTVSEDGTKLDGTWSQGEDRPLSFRRDEPFVAAEKPSPVDGIWLGTLEAAKLRVQIQVKTDHAGKLSCSLDSLDQGAMGIPCENAQLSGKKFSFEVSTVKGKWSGTLAENGNELDGTWTQAAGLPLRFTRQQAAIAPKPPEPLKYDDPMAPVSVENLKPVLDRDLAAALKDGALAPSTNGGVVIGVLQHGTRRLFTYGPVKQDSLFEIGSISKTFTALTLAQMVAQKKAKLDEPVRELLPPRTVARPDGPEITLLDLATQHSGLPRMPSNIAPADMQDPYVDYRPANLYDFVAKQGVGRSASPQFNYSNLGFGLLGQALANRAKLSYLELLRAEVTGPLAMNDTVVKLSPEQEKRFTQGHGPRHQPAKPWNFDALAGAGAIRSTASDMLTYLEAYLHPPRAARTLATALEMCREVHADALPNMKIALAWLVENDTGAYWHNGGTGGFSSYALFNPKEDYALVVLYNTTLSANGSFADRLGAHIAGRISGRKAIALHE